MVRTLNLGKARCDVSGSVGFFGNYLVSSHSWPFRCIDPDLPANLLSQVFNNILLVMFLFLLVRGGKESESCTLYNEGEECSIRSLFLAPIPPHCFSL